MTDPAPPRKRRLFSRALDLGNHNKLIAAATLVTLATGVPYLVSAALGVLGEDVAQPNLSLDLLDHALRDSLLRMREEVGLASLNGAGPGAEGAPAAEAALTALGASAARPEATEAERQRVLDAFRDYTLGRPSAAFAEFARVADEQEARGAPALAADTWRHRASLRMYADSRGAIEDFERAEMLGPGGAEDLLNWGRLLATQRESEEAFRVYRRAVRMARTEGDPVVLARALHALSQTNPKPGGQADPAVEEERAAAATEALALVEAHLREEPDDVALLGMFADLVFRGAIQELADLGFVVPEGQEPPMALALARLRVEYERVQKQLDVQGPQAGRAAALAQMAGQMVPMAAMSDRPPEEWMDLALEAVEWARRTLDSPDREHLQLIQAWGGLANALNLLGMSEDLERGVAVGQECLELSRELSTIYSSSPIGRDRLKGTMTILAGTLVRAERVEEAVALVQELAQISRDSVSVYDDPENGWLSHAGSLFGAQFQLPPSEAALAVELLEEALAALDEHVRSPGKAAESARTRTMLEDLLGQRRAELEAQAAPADGED